MLQGFKDFLEAELGAFRKAVARPGTKEGLLDGQRKALLARVNSRYRSIPADFRFDADGLDDAVASLRSALSDTDSTTHAGSTRGTRSDALPVVGKSPRRH